MSARAWGAMVAVSAGALVAGCKDDFVIVRLEGTDGELAAAPREVTVTIAGSGSRKTFSYAGRFAPAAQPGGPVGASDFVVTLGTGAGDLLDVAARVAGSPRHWGGDARVALPANGRTITIALAGGELNIGPARVTEGDTQTSAPFETGVVLAWPDLDGVSARVERDPDRPLQRSQLLVSEPNAGSIRIASRPARGTTGNDFAALVWHSENGKLGLRTFASGRDGREVGIGQGADVHVACTPPGASYAAVAISLERGRLWASFHAEDASDAFAGGEPRRVEVALPPKFNVRAVLGIVATPDDTFVAAIRGGEGTSARTSLLRVSASGAIVQRSELPGDLRAIAASAGGETLLVAGVDVAGPGGVLDLRRYDARTLALDGAPRRIAATRDMPAPNLAHVSIASCALVWPETRRDGTTGVDLRYLYLSADGRAVGTPRRASISLEGDSFAPTASCLAPSRAYVSFITRTDPAAFLGQLQLRLLPPPDPAAFDVKEPP